MQNKLSIINAKLNNLIQFLADFELQVSNYWSNIKLVEATQCTQLLYKRLHTLIRFTY